MSDMGPWTNEDFESLSWHDVHVHGFRFEAFDENEGCADLVLDIDYILKWDKSGDAFSFLISQANLRFHKVFGFKFELDYLLQPHPQMMNGSAARPAASIGHSCQALSFHI
jgi:hypothetical protein